MYIYIYIKGGKWKLGDIHHVNSCVIQPKCLKHSFIIILNDNVMSQDSEKCNKVSLLFVHRKMNRSCVGEKNISS